MKLSENLDLGELTRSEGAKRAGISNKPTAEHIENMKKFILCLLSSRKKLDIINNKKIGFLIRFFELRHFLIADGFH